MLLGILKGTFGLIAFYMVVYLMLPGSPAIATYALALFVSVLLTAGWLWQRRPFGALSSARSTSPAWSAGRPSSANLGCRTRCG